MIDFLIQLWFVIVYGGIVLAVILELRDIARDDQAAGGWPLGCGAGKMCDETVTHQIVCTSARRI